MRRERIVELSVAMSLSLVSGVVAFLCVPFDLPRAEPTSLPLAPRNASAAASEAPAIESRDAIAEEAPSAVHAAPRAERGQRARAQGDVEALLVPPNGLVLGDPFISPSEPILPPRDELEACDETDDTAQLFHAMRAPSERGIDGAADVLFLLGVSRHSVLDLASAADYYEAFAEHDASRDSAECTEAERARGTCVDAPLALERAVALRVALGDERRAIELARRYVESYGETRVEDAARMSDRAGQILARTDPDEAASHFALHTRRFSRHVSAPMALRHYVDRGRSEWRAGDREAAARTFRQALRVWRRGASDVAALSPDTDGSEFSETLEAAAEAGYYLAELRHDAFDAIPLPSYGGHGARSDIERWVESTLRPAVLRKVRALRSAERAYRTVADLGVTRHRVAALARTGEMYRELARAFESAPLPEVREERELEIAIAPEDWRERPRSRLEAAAVEAFESCLSLAISSRVYVDDARACGDALSEIAPERHPRAVELAPRGMRVREEPLAPTPRAPAPERAAGECAG